LKKITLVLIAVSLFSAVEAKEAAESKEPLLLSNDTWPPFILEGTDQGTAEQLVCQALSLQGWPCRVEVKDWEIVLQEARAGAIDGIAAAWRNPDREQYLLFSEPYLSNRIIPVISNRASFTVTSANSLAGLRVALVADFAYGETIEGLKPGFTTVTAKYSLDALKDVNSGKADAALVDELVARNLLDDPVMQTLMMVDTVLAFRDLHFAVSRQHPRAQAVIADFQRGYKQMLSDGSVNEILNVDWLATDFGQSGKLNVVMRSGVSLDDLAPPTNDGEVFALEASEYDLMRQRNLDPNRVNYQVDGKSYSNLQSALDDVFGKDTVCKHKNYTSQFDCTDLFKKN
jgi:ABC-type amino acid transport substrate-binding protein